MFPEIVIYLGIPALIIYVKWMELRFDRRTKILVERQRAETMLKLKSSQSEERENAFVQQQMIIVAAAKKLNAHKLSAQQAPATPAAHQANPSASAPQAPVKVNAQSKASSKTIHKVNDDVWLNASPAPPAPTPAVTQAPSMEDDVFIAEEDDFVDHHQNGHLN